MSEQIEQTESDAVPDLAPATPAIGLRLRQAREAMGLQLSEVAQTLKLGQRQVDALERDDWAALPGQTFIRGFIRNYARLVQLDPSPLMADLDRVLVKPQDTLDVPEVKPATMPSVGSVGRRDRNVALFGMGLLLLAALAYFLLPNDLAAWRDRLQSLLDGTPAVTEPVLAVAPANEPVFPPGASTEQVLNPQVLNGEPAASAPATGDVVAIPTAAPSATIVPAEVPLAPPAVDARPPQLRFVVSKASWVEVRDRENKTLFSQRLLAPSEQLVSGQGPFNVVVGYAPGVRLYSRGQVVDLEPHTKGDVARLVLE